MRVPVYDSPQVQQDALPGARVQADTRTGLDQVAQGVQQLGAGVSDVLEREKQKADAAAITDAETQFQSTINTALYDRNRGVMHAQGENAVAASEGVYDTLKQARAKIAEGLANDDQKRVFQMRSGGLFEDTRRAVESHVGQQIQVANQASLKGRMDVGLDAIANGYADPKLAARQEIALEGPIQSLARSPEEAQANLADWRAKVTATRLNAFLSAKDYAGAQALFDAQKDRLGAQAPQYEHAVQTLRGAVVGDQNAVALVNKARKANGFLDDSVISSEVEKMPEGPDKQATFEALSKYLSLEKQAEAQKKANVFNSGLTDFLTNHSLADVNPTTRSWLHLNDPVGEQRLEELAAGWGVKQDRDPTPDQSKAFVKFNLDLSHNPEKYADMSSDDYAREWGHQLTEKDWRAGGEAIARMVTDSQRGDKQLTLPPMAHQAVDQMFQRAFDEASPNPDKWDEGKQGLYRKVLDYVVQQERDYRRAHTGKQPDIDQYQKWAQDKLHTEHVPNSGVTVRGHTFFGTDVPAVDAEVNYGVTPTAPAPATLEDQPRQPPAGAPSGDTEALQWLLANPKHPRAQAVREALRKKGVKL